MSRFVEKDSSIEDDIVATGKDNSRQTAGSIILSNAVVEPNFGGPLISNEITLRKRRVWSPDADSLASDDIDLLDDEDEDDDDEEEDGVGCPLPSTPEDNELLEAEVYKMLFHLSIVIILELFMVSDD